MEIARNMNELHAARATILAKGDATLALVPTMGALHEGHLSLVHGARRAGHVTAASIFVNPTQFGPNEDFGRYPRDPEADCALLAEAGCQLVWMPDVGTMYPPGDATVVEVAGLSSVLEGAVRPGHFRGVATVVTKLLGQVRPDFAYFGEKDWQQVQVIRRFVADLFLPVGIMVLPTLRESDGLAMSSRNRYLDASERARAPLVHAVMCRARDALRAGAPVAATLAAGQAELDDGGFVVDYFVLVDGSSLARLSALDEGARLLLAARLGSTRLLDTIEV